MQNQNQEIYFIVVIGILLGLLLVGFIVTILFLYQRRQHRQEQELTHMKDKYEQEALKSQLEIQENTFKSISQELHDNIGQLLSVVKITLSILPVEATHPAYEQIQNTRQVLSKAIADLSNLTKSLHTDRIAQVGLSESVQFELEALRKSGILDVQFNRTGTEFNLPEQRAVFLFRMFQEMLNNILKHSHATRVVVNLIYTLDYNFVLEVEDNGQGFNVEEKRKSSASSSGVGLKSIFNRAEMIGADLQMYSQPGKGTRVIIKLPHMEE